MGVLDTPQPGSDSWWRELLAEVRSMRRELDMLRASDGRYGAIYTSEGITVRDGGDLTIEDNGSFTIGTDASMVITGDEPEDPKVGWFGDLYSAGNKIGRGMYIQTRDGRRVATIAENIVDDTVWLSFHDGEGNELLHMDRSSGYGLAGPQMSFPIRDWGGAPWPSTSSSSWETMGIADVPLIHPQLRFYISAAISSGTVGEFRIRFGSDVVATSGNQTGDWSHDVDVSAYPNRQVHSTIRITIEHRRVSGSGTVNSRVHSIVGKGT